MYCCVNVFVSNTFAFLKPTTIQIKLITSFIITFMWSIVSIEQKQNTVVPYSTEITVHLS
jgi:hypothetical protein